VHTSRLLKKPTFKTTQNFLGVRDNYFPHYIPCTLGLKMFAVIYYFEGGKVITDYANYDVTRSQKITYKSVK